MKNKGASSREVNSLQSCLEIECYVSFLFFFKYLPKLVRYKLGALALPLTPLKSLRFFSYQKGKQVGSYFVRVTSVRWPLGLRSFTYILSRLR